MTFYRVRLPRLVEDLHPNLRAHGYRVTSDQTLFKTVKYNCVAWAAIGDIEKWWQAGRRPGYFWPRGILGDESFQSYIHLYELLGYKACSNDRRLEILYEKVALFEDGDGEFAHVAYQLFSGWTSKLGDREDIKHNTLAAMEGGEYGRVKVIMKKRSSMRGFLSRISPVITSRFWPLDREALHRY